MKDMKERSKESKESKDRKKATATAAAVSAGADAYTHEIDADVKAFIEMFNGEMVEHRASIPTIYRLTPGYVRMLRALLRDHGQEKVEEMVHRAALSDFLNNHGRRPFLASVEWLLREENFIKVINGNYDNTADGWKPRDPIEERKQQEREQRLRILEMEEAEREQRRRQREYDAAHAATPEEIQRIMASFELPRLTPEQQEYLRRRK